MSDDSSTDRDAVPGSGAGDAAHTTQIPRIERPEPASGKTDKGRPRPASKSVAPKKNMPATKTPAPKPVPTKSRGSAPKAPGGPTGRPLTASDYARTTSPSPSTTAVIPAVKDDRAEGSTKTSKQRKPEKPSVAAAAAAQMAEQKAAGGGRAATLRLSYVDPWSVTRMAFAISVALMIVSVVAVAIFWLVLEVTGVWSQIDNSVTSVLSDDSSSFSITDYLGFGRLVGLSLVLSALNVVIATVLATIAAHLYNLAAQLLGGFQVTFTSQD